MDIGTAKPTKDETKDIKHHLIDFVNPNEEYNVSMYKDKALEAIQEIINHGKTPIIVGGTGLYINTLVNGIEFEDIEKDLEYEKELEDLATQKGNDFLFGMLEEVDPESAKVIEKNNTRRVIRALEIYKVTGKTKTQIDKDSLKETPYEYLVYGIDLPRDILYDRINKRVDIMLEQGLGYKEVIEYLNEQISYDEMVEKIKMQSRRYAKRQITWFKKTKNIIWLDGSDKEKMIEQITNDYQK